MPTKNDTAAYSALMDDERLRPEVIRMLTNCAIIPCMSGFEMLVDAVILHASGNFDNIGDVYAVVGRVRGHIERIVKRAIQYTLDNSKSFIPQMEHRLGIRLTEAPSTDRALIYLTMMIARDDCAASALSAAVAAHAEAASAVDNTDAVSSGETDIK